MSTILNQVNLNQCRSPGFLSALAFVDFYNPNNAPADFFYSLMRIICSYLVLIHPDEGACFHISIIFFSIEMVKLIFRSQVVAASLAAPEVGGSALVRHSNSLNQSHQKNTQTSTCIFTRFCRYR